MNTGSEPKIQVPFSNVQVCHDALRREALSLWAWFETRLLPAANSAQSYRQRLDAVLQLKEQAWIEYVTKHQGSSRAVEGPWNCTVGDLALALCQRAIDSAAAAPDPETRRGELQEIEELVTQKLGWSGHVPLLKNLLRAAAARRQ